MSSVRSVGQFEIRRVLGEGGIGRVYEALDQDLGRMVALKALKPEVSHDSGFVERFRAEASSLARLHHPNITTLYTLHREGRDLYMVMELVGGRTLETVVEHLGRLGTREVLAIAAQACAGLGYAHRMGVIHRDIKPPNLMLTDAGELKIMDFGIARLRGSQRMTRAGSIIGTLAYMPPEQIKGADNDERSDIYSLGCVLYEMLCGAPPFSAETEYDLIRAQVETLAPVARQTCPDLDPAVDEALARALAKSPSDRHPTASAFAAALGANAIPDPASVLRERIVARLAAAPAKATRAIGPAVPPSNPPSSGPAAKTRAPAGAARAAVADPLPPAPPPRRGPSVPAVALGGAALVLLLGVGALVLLGPGTPEPPAEVNAAATAKASTPPPTPAPVPPPPSNLADAPRAMANAEPPRSSSILPPPDAVATAVKALPALDMPACPPAADTPDLLTGRVDGLTDAGWPRVGTTEAALFGIDGIAEAQRPALSRWIAQKGGDLICCPVAGHGYRCVTAGSKQDVSQLALLNGMARATADAPDRYRAAEQTARQSHLGLWR